MASDKEKRGKYLKAAAVFMFWIAVWEIIALVVGKELILPDPLAVVKSLFRLVMESDFWLSTATTIIRIVAGFVLGLAIGILFSILTSYVPVLDSMLSPFVKVIKATPVASFIILVLLWIGREMVPLFMAMLMVIPVIWGNITEAYKSTDVKMIEMGRAYRFSSFDMFRYIYVPAVLPGLKAACMTSVGLAWKSGIAAEVLSQPKFSIGTNLYNSKLYLETPDLFAWTLVVIVLSFIVEKLFLLLFDRFFRKVFR